MTHARRRTQTSAVGVLVVSLWFFTFPAGSAQAPSHGPIRTYTNRATTSFTLVGHSADFTPSVATRRA